MTTTFEEAKSCPKCGLPGDDAQTLPVARGKRVHIIFCRNAACSWFNTSWIVQVNPDGTIPTPEYQKKEPKKFPALPIEEQRARDIQAALRADRERQQHKGTEVPNPNR